MVSTPFVSVIVLNYNGRHYLETCLGALREQDYPADRFEVILVDNGSSDGSVEMARMQFPWVRILVNETNLGFAGGNNVGIRAARGDYVALLNNDTEAEPGWLSAMVEAAEEDERIGACTSKLVLFHDRLPLYVQVSPSFSPREWGFSLDSRRLGVRLLQATVRDRDGERPVEFLTGVYGEESAEGARFRWTAEEAVLGLPVEQRDEDLCLQLRVSTLRPDRPEVVRIAQGCGGKVLGTHEMKGGSEALIRLTVPAELLRQATPVIQNAGSLVSLDGSGRDRGAVIEGPFHYYEADRGQYNRKEEVFAACGAALLYRRAMLEDIGLFDESFFMYYEDTDLSWRARLRGWKIVYVPYAVVRHVHCGSSGEWSPLFTFHVKKNRLAMVIKNGSWRQVALGWTGYLGALARSCGTWGRVFPTGRSAAWDAGRRLAVEIRAGAWVIASWIELLGKRRRIQRTRLLPQREIERLFSPLNFRGARDAL